MLYETAKSRLVGQKVQIKNIRSIVNNLFFKMAPNYHYRTRGMREYK